MNKYTCWFTKCLKYRLDAFKKHESWLIIIYSDQAIRKFCLSLQETKFYSVLPGKSLDNEKQLLVELANGDEQAFSKIYLYYYPRIYGVSLMYLKAHNFAEDVTQDVFVKLWSQRQKLTQIENLESFLFIIARNQVYNALRKQVGHKDYISFIHNILEQEADTPENLLIDRQKIKLLNNIIASLPPRQQEAYRLSRDNGLPYQAIAIKMNISLSTVKEHVSNALHHIKQMLLKHQDELLLLILTTGFSGKFFF